MNDSNHSPSLPKHFCSWASVGICISTGVCGNGPREFWNKHGEFPECWKIWKYKIEYIIGQNKNKPEFLVKVGV